MIIGLGYQKQQGKDTVARYLTREHGYRHYAFADALKTSVRLAYDIPADALEDENKDLLMSAWSPTLQAFLPSARVLCQTLGQALRATMGNEIWIEQLDKRIMEDLSIENCIFEGCRCWTSSAPAVGADIVISDVRFPEEAAYVKQLGGKLAKVDRLGYVSENDGHISETAMDHFQGWDGFIRADDGDLKGLYNSTQSFLRKVSTDDLSDRAN